MSDQPPPAAPGDPDADADINDSLRRVGFLDQGDFDYLVDLAGFLFAHPRDGDQHDEIVGYGTTLTSVLHACCVQRVLEAIAARHRNYVLGIGPLLHDIRTHPADYEPWRFRCTGCDFQDARDPNRDNDLWLDCMMEVAALALAVAQGFYYYREEAGAGPGCTDRAVWCRVIEASDAPLRVAGLGIVANFPQMNWMDRIGAARDRYEGEARAADYAGLFAGPQALRRRAGF